MQPFSLGITTLLGCIDCAPTPNIMKAWARRVSRPERGVQNKLVCSALGCRVFLNYSHMSSKIIRPWRCVAMKEHTLFDGSQARFASLTFPLKWGEERIG